MIRLALISATLAILFTLGSSSASAQGAATPTSFTGRETPDPALCTVTPRSAAILTPAAGATSTAAPGPSTPAAISEPVGQDVSPQTNAEITTTIRELYACFNGSHPLQTLALFTERGAAQYVTNHPELTTGDAIATPTPPTVEQRLALVALADLRVLPDGRVFALVTQDDPNRPPDGPEPVFVTLSKQGDRWLVDDLQILAAGA